MPLQATTLVMTTKLADLVLLPYLRVRSIVHDCFFRIRQSYTPKDLFFWHRSYITNILSQAVAGTSSSVKSKPNYFSPPHYDAT